MAKDKKTVELSGGYVSGAKRANISKSEALNDWWVGFGKDESCQFEGSWWDMICFARNILAHENTAKVSPEFHRPNWKNDNYNMEDCPYDEAKYPDSQR